MRGMEPNRNRLDPPKRSDPYAMSEIKGTDDLPECFKELPEVGEGCNLTPDQSGKWRLCVDFRKVSQVSRPVVYPIPLIQDILAALKGAKHFSTLDLSKGFNQIALDDDAFPKAGFSTIHGQFEYMRLPFGLKSATGNFQRCMERVLGDLQ